MEEDIFDAEIFGSEAIEHAPEGSEIGIPYTDLLVAFLVPLLLIGFGIYFVWEFYKFLRKTSGKTLLRDFFSRVLVGYGFLCVCRPFIYYIRLNIGDSYEKYIWIINGQFPFSHFGGGPFQLAMIIGSLFFGFGLMFVGYQIR